MHSKDELIEYLSTAQLCALPQSASRMIELAKDPNHGPKEYAEPISADLGLSTQVLRFVNSSFFGFRHKITSLPMALTLASVRTIRNFVFWNGLFAVLPNPQCGPFSVKKLFQDALRRAVFARVVAERFTEYDSDEVFMCALLQDMAIPILAKKWGNEYADMIQQSNTQQVRLSTLERDRMGWDHAEAGGMLTVNWGLGEFVADIVSQHTNSFFADYDISEPSLVGITALSALLPKVQDHQWFENIAFVDGYRKMLGPKLAELPEIFKIADEGGERLMSMVNLGTVPKQFKEHWDNTLKDLTLTDSENPEATEEQLEEYFAQHINNQ